MNCRYKSLHFTRPPLDVSGCLSKLITHPWKTPGEPERRSAAPNRSLDPIKSAYTSYSSSRNAPATVSRIYRAWQGLHPNRHFFWFEVRLRFSTEEQPLTFSFFAPWQRFFHFNIARVSHVLAPVWMRLSGVIYDCLSDIRMGKDRKKTSIVSSTSYLNSSGSLHPIYNRFLPFQSSIKA